MEVRTRSTSGHASHQIIDWSVQPNVPEVLPIDERDLSKLISCVFLNAIKFTENGTISVVVSLSRNLRSVRINVVDNGAGIPKDFLPELFKPFSREDDSLTRSKEGLGLGLLVGKGLARKLGGDINLVHTETSGERKGSEFEIKVPIGGGESESTPGSPFDRTPTPFGSSPQMPRSTSSYMSTSSNTTLAIPTCPMPQLQDGTPTCTAFSHSTAISSSISRRESSISSKTLISAGTAFDSKLSEKYPLTFLVAEDNKINRKLLVSMLSKLGYRDVYEAFDGREAVRFMKEITLTEPDRRSGDHHTDVHPLFKPVDIILMDLWMPEMDGYEATEKIFDMFKSQALGETPICLAPPTVLAVSADATEKAVSRARTVGMEGFMTKPYKLLDLQRLIEEVCGRVEA
jgi:CheY-like chemotaxis protein